MSDRPTRASILEAQTRLNRVVHKTPLVSSHSLSELTDTDLRFKPENLQVTGSFKIRGAFNKISQVAQSGAKGVITASSGNHGQAVAWAARYFGLKAHIVVPTTAPAIKVRSAEAFGATVEACGTTSRDRLDRARELAEAWDFIFVPPYDDPLIMSGQGTVGLEILEQAPNVDTVLVPVGGGGLISGIATAIKETRPNVKVIGVEPEGAAKAFQSRRQGRRVELDATQSIADGLITLSLGHMTHPVVDHYVDDLVTVSDDQIRKAFTMLFTRLKLVVEPSGAATTALALDSSRTIDIGRHPVAVISGGNVDPSVVPGLFSPV